MDIKKNDDIKLNIESVTSEGSAVGHYNGIAVFVRGARRYYRCAYHQNIKKICNRHNQGYYNRLTEQD